MSRRYKVKVTSETGNVPSVPEFPEATPGLGVLADGSDAVPPAPEPTGHHTEYPTIEMKPEMFIWLFKSQPWRYVYNKKET
jgi:hypothetical protein